MSVPMKSIKKYIDSITSLDDLLEINRWAKQRYDQLRDIESRSKKQSLLVGDKIKFKNKMGSQIIAKITKINIKTVICKDESGKSYKVDITLVESMEDNNDPFTES